MKELTMREACALIGEGKWNEIQRRTRPALGRPAGEWTYPESESHVIGWLASASGLDAMFRHNPPLPKGEISLEQAREAVESGKQIQVMSDYYPEWATYNREDWVSLKDEVWACPQSNYHFRIAPEPKRVPLGPEDVLAWTQFRRIGTDNRLNYNDASSAGVWIPCEAFALWKTLMDEWERTDDSGRTWQPCWKEVEG